MKLMSCFDKFQSDRVCELCGITNAKQHDYCEKLMLLKEKIIKLSFVKNCKFKTDAYEEYEHYYECSRFNNNCAPEKNCLKEKYNQALQEYDIIKEKYIKIIEGL